MPPETNFNALFADYRDMAKCLFAIQALSDSGAFSSYPELQRMLRVFEQSTLLKLYVRAITILYSLDGTVLPPTFPSGDFDYPDFSEYDFNDGEGNPEGDFSMLDYTNDFLITYLDSTNTSFSSFFQTILNILYVLQRKIDQITTDELSGLDNALVDVIDAFEAIKAYLVTIELSPCLASGAEYANNSPEIYLQAAGSDGADGVPEGIHLRWAFAGELGLNHLPTGPSIKDGTTPALFNLPFDYVRIYRSPYTAPARGSLSFESVRPVINFSAKRWTYFINTSVNGKSLNSKITLVFTDAAQYDQLAVNVDPLNNYFGFLAAYSGIIEVGIASKALFYAGFGVVNNSATQNGIVKIEARCTPDMEDAAAEKVYARKTDSVPPGTTQVSITAENIQTLKVLLSPGCVLATFDFETYHDLLTVTETGDWTEVGGGFALSVADEMVFERLETPAYPIDHLWPQYNEGTTVKLANYHHKWDNDDDTINDPSIKSVVTDYLSVSKTDPRAMITLPDQNSNPGNSGLQVSLVDVLNLVSTDYHIARMLGLGCIDVVPDDTQYIYRIAYTNQVSLDDTSLLTRYYTTLPSSKANNLLPAQPEIRPVKYGLPVAESSFSTAFDVNGYARYAPTRAINIGRQPFNDEITGYDFFADPALADNTNIFINSRPVNYGIKYRAATNPGYQKPEITQDLAFGVQYNAYDPGSPDGVPETIPVPDNQDSLYLHMEKTPGVHYYAIYGINWFSRASPLSEEVATDDTEFPLQNRLVAPTDLAVQYVQQEDTLIFTTRQEQEWLAGRAITFPGQDINLTRIAFNWLDIIDISSLPDNSPTSLAKAIRPNTVNIFFDPELPVEVQGMIKNIAAVPGQEGQLLLYTSPYTRIDGTVLSPVIDSAAFFRFNNSLLNTPQGQFSVTGITAAADGPVITVNKIVQNNLQEDDQLPESYGLVQTYQSPLIGSYFSMVENLSNAANWQPLSEQISLFSFADPDAIVIEDFTDSEGNYTKNWIGGVSWDAVITPVLTVDSPPTILPGYYRLTFNQSLAPNPQVNLPFDPADPGKNEPTSRHTPHVEWYKGWCRISPASDTEPLQKDKKLLEVLRIEHTDHLQLVIYDPAYQDDPIPISSSDSDVTRVNFHPGYRAYLFPEPAPYAFNGPNILPADNQTSRKTMIGLQTADTRSGGSGFTSTVCSPAILLARLIVQPVKLDPPNIFSQIVRPNATGKAALTFDITVPPAANHSARNPFGFKFCRISEEDVLHALYLPLTVETILENLAALTDDPDYNQRYFELVNLIFDPDIPGHFRVFNATPESYGFPVPDKFPPPSSPPDPPEELIQQYSQAIQSAILPLTATTPIFKFIKPGFQTANNQPAIRDINGKLMDPADPAFDPFPMIRQYPKDGVLNATNIRFTDYTLNASSRGLYFYAAAEVTNELVPGPLSGFAGPVTIADTTPPEPPVIRTFSIVPSGPGITSPISVVFQVAPTAPYDNITKMRFYRTTNISLTDALATMGTPVVVEISGFSPTGYELTDTLSDIVNIPFGQPLYYRLASVRSIINELNLPEDVVSVGSEVAVITLIDTVNPDAPEVSPNNAKTELHWTTSVNNGTYYLYQQNAKGNWNLLFTNYTASPGQIVHFTLPALQPVDDDGNILYYRFKVRVQNASGLFNLTDKITTISV